jgi:hypothetical protein
MSLVKLPWKWLFVNNIVVEVCYCAMQAAMGDNAWMFVFKAYSGIIG